MSNKSFFKKSTDTDILQSQEIQTMKYDILDRVSTSYLSDTLNTITTEVYNQLAGKVPNNVVDTLTSRVNVIESLESAYTYYVDPNGVDTNNGSLRFPFKTIQKAISTCETFNDGKYRNVKISFGKYSEALTITKPLIQLQGATSSRYVNQCSITGNININYMSAITGFLLTDQISIVGLQVNGTLFDSSSITHTLLVTDCNFISTEVAIHQRSSVAFSFTSPTLVTYLERINATSTAGTGSNKAIFTIENGYTTILSCNLVATGNLTTCLSMTGTGITGETYNGVAFNSFTNTRSSANVNAPVYFQNSGATLTRHFYNNVISFPTTIAKNVSITGVGQGMGLFLSNVGSIGGTVNVYVVNNTFLLNGTLTTGLAVNSTSATAGIVLHGGNIAGYNMAYGIVGTTTSPATKYPFTAMA